MLTSLKKIITELEETVKNLENLEKRERVNKKGLSSLQQLSEHGLNFEGIPIGITLKSISRDQEFNLTVEKDYYTTIAEDGTYLHHSSLSAAAYYVSGVRRSGWKFWYLQNGISIGEAIGRFE